MQQRPFGELGAASALTLGGGGIGQVWGATTRDECVATVREAVDSGIDVLDLAPSYGNGEAETVIGDAFDGSLPSGVRVTTKCRVGGAPPGQVYDLLSESLNASLQRMKLDHVDVMFVHNWITLGRRGGRAHNDRPGRRRSRRAGVRAARRRGAHPLLGAHRHRRAGRHHQIAQRRPTARLRPVHREPARLRGRTAALRGARPGRAKSSQPPTPTAPP